ncbi:protein kinase [Nocardia sp. NPDC057353]|uniref:serine/threonine-protein kinase n=1 Tax=Nocardia sp. NPDC057353 TaxID=3346104 RepID=UPI0036295E32
MLERGEVFAGFTVERLLGAGGMGSVYLARQPRMDRLIALKLLNRELFTHTEVRARFEREADLVAQLDHPSIVAVYDRGTEDGQLWISMQYVDGVDAGTVDVTELPPERAVQIIEGVAAALDYAHSIGILHRDVKPGNIMLARSQGQGERVFLTDFGIARLREDSTHLTQDGMFTATLAYASPEQMTGNPLDHRTDQYSLACALYWLLLGVGPFDSPNPADIIHGHLNMVPAPIAPRRPGISPAMDLVIAKAMAKHPAHRYGSCGEFAAAARAALNAPGSGGMPAVAPAFGGVVPAAAPGGAVAPAGPMPQAPGAPMQAPGALGAVAPAQLPPAPQGGSPNSPGPGQVGGAAPNAAARSGGVPPHGPSAGPPQTPPGQGQGGAPPPNGPGPVQQNAAGPAQGGPLPPNGSGGGPVPQAPPGQGQGVGMPLNGPGPVQQNAAGPGQGAGMSPNGPVHPGSPGPGPGGRPPNGPPPGRGMRPPRRGGGRRLIGTLLLGWLAVVVVALLVLVGILFVVLRSDEGGEGSATTQGRAAAPPTPTTQSATAEADPLAASRRAFPMLVPFGRDEVGTGYRGTDCVLVTPDEDRLRFEEIALSQGTWVRAWRCDRDEDDPGSLSYVVLQFPAPAAARAAVDALPAHTRSAERKDGAPAVLHRWIRPDPAGPFTEAKGTARLIVSFGDDPQRAAFLISVANHGDPSGTGPEPSAQAAVDDWWEAARL